LAVALLTGGWDRPYVHGLATVLAQQGIAVDLIAGDDLGASDFPGATALTVHSFKETPTAGAGITANILRVLAYYRRLIAYAWSAKPRIFHIIWNNGYDTFDRVALMLYYRILGKRVLLTAHNVNAGRRDAKDTQLNRVTLKFQYQLCEHIFVHTEKMKQELVRGFDIRSDAVTVIPFGINNSIPDTALTPAEARKRLGIMPGEKTLLFFGNIAPYKGLEYLVNAFRQITGGKYTGYRLIIAGRPKPGADNAYWERILSEIGSDASGQGILLRIEFIPDSDTEVYFKAADVMVLPYTDIFQSGVLFLGFNFGLPALVADVGALKDDVVEGQNGFVFSPRDTTDLARAIETYFASDLYRDLDKRRSAIREDATRTHSWDIVADMTRKVYLSAVA
jgi:glycosyltransferase involved in cell wall biosynthesis